MAERITTTVQITFYTDRVQCFCFFEHALVPAAIFIDQKHGIAYNIIQRYFEFYLVYNITEKTYEKKAE